MNTNRLPPLNALRAFESAARHESFLEAATEQNVTSGSISRHVRLLESYLGIQAVQKAQQRGVALTSAGKGLRRGGRAPYFRELRGATDLASASPGARPRDRHLNAAHILGTLALSPHSVIPEGVRPGGAAGRGAQRRARRQTGRTSMHGSCIRRDSIQATASRGCSERRCFPSAARGSARRCRRAPLPTKSSASPSCTTSTGTPTGRTGRVPSAPNDRRTCRRHALCALQGRHPGRRSTAWAWRSDMARWSPRSSRAESSSPLNISRSSFREVLSPGHERFVSEQPDPGPAEGLAPAGVRRRQAVERLTSLGVNRPALEAATSLLSPPGCAPWHATPIQPTRLAVPASDPADRMAGARLSCQPFQASRTDLVPVRD